MRNVPQKIFALPGSKKLTLRGFIVNQIIAEIEKNSTEVIRAELSEFKGHDLFSLRVYADREGQDPRYLKCPTHHRHEV
jgi:hypothetical protein